MSVCVTGSESFIGCVLLKAHGRRPWYGSAVGNPSNRGGIRVGGVSEIRAPRGHARTSEARVRGRTNLKRIFEEA
jgi:hypothetical protein